MWQNNTSTLDGDKQAISIGNDRPTKLWQTVCSTPALFQTAHQPNQHPPCALGCPLAENRGTGESCSVCEGPLTARHPLLRGGKLLQVRECDWKTRHRTGMLCALSGLWYTAGSEPYGDHLRHTLKWARTPWLSATKAPSIFRSHCPRAAEMEKPDKMLSGAAAMCPGERINSVSNIPERDPTQFWAAIWILALFHVSNFLSSTNQNSLCPSL